MINKILHSFNWTCEGLETPRCMTQHTRFCWPNGRFSVLRDHCPALDCTQCYVTDPSSCAIAPDMAAVYHLGLPGIIAAVVIVGLFFACLHYSVSLESH